MNEIDSDDVKNLWEKINCFNRESYSRLLNLYELAGKTKSKQEHAISCTANDAPICRGETKELESPSTHDLEDETASQIKPVTLTDYHVYSSDSEESLEVDGVVGGHTNSQDHGDVDGVKGGETNSQGHTRGDVDGIEGGEINSQGDTRGDVDGVEGGDTNSQGHGDIDGVVGGDTNSQGDTRGDVEGGETNSQGHGDIDGVEGGHTNSQADTRGDVDGVEGGDTNSQGHTRGDVDGVEGGHTNSQADTRGNVEGGETNSQGHTRRDIDDNVPTTPSVPVVQLSRDNIEDDNNAEEFVDVIGKTNEIKNLPIASMLCAMDVFKHDVSFQSDISALLYNLIANHSWDKVAKDLDVDYLSHILVNQIYEFNLVSFVKEHEDNINARPSPTSNAMENAKNIAETKSFNFNYFLYNIRILNAIENRLSLNHREYFMYLLLNLVDNKTSSLFYVMNCSYFNRIQKRLVAESPVTSADPENKENHGFRRFRVTWVAMDTITARYYHETNASFLSNLGNYPSNNVNESDPPEMNIDQHEPPQRNNSNRSSPSEMNKDRSSSQLNLNQPSSSETNLNQPSFSETNLNQSTSSEMNLDQSSSPKMNVNLSSSPVMTLSKSSPELNVNISSSPEKNLNQSSPEICARRSSPQLKPNQSPSTKTTTNQPSSSSSSVDSPSMSSVPFDLKYYHTAFGMSMLNGVNDDKVDHVVHCDNEPDDSYLSQSSEDSEDNTFDHISDEFIKLLINEHLYVEKPTDVTLKAYYKKAIRTVDVDVIGISEYDSSVLFVVPHNDPTQIHTMKINGTLTPLQFPELICAILSLIQAFFSTANLATFQYEYVKTLSNLIIYDNVDVTFACMKLFKDIIVNLTPAEELFNNIVTYIITLPVKKSYIFCNIKNVKSLEILLEMNMFLLSKYGAMLVSKYSGHLYLEFLQSVLDSRNPLCNGVIVHAKSIFVELFSGLTKEFVISKCKCEINIANNVEPMRRRHVSEVDAVQPSVASTPITPKEASREHDCAGEQPIAMICGWDMPGANPECKVKQLCILPEKPNFEKIKIDKCHRIQVYQKRLGSSNNFPFSINIKINLSIPSSPENKYYIQNEEVNPSSKQYLIIEDAPRNINKIRLIGNICALLNSTNLGETAMIYFGLSYCVCKETKDVTLKATGEFFNVSERDNLMQTICIEIARYLSPNINSCLYNFLFVPIVRKNIDGKLEYKNNLHVLELQLLPKQDTMYVMLYKDVANHFYRTNISTKRCTDNGKLLTEIRKKTNQRIQTSIQPHAILLRKIYKIYLRCKQIEKCE